MKKIVFIISALMLITTFGCESDETTNPVVSAEYQIVLENLPDSLTWLAGEELTIPVNALVLNKEGSLAPGIRVEFAVTSESGEFDTPGNVSDQHGRVSAIATLAPEEGWQEFSLLLIVPGGSAGGRVAVQGIRQPSRIAFVAPNTTFKTGLEATIETTFKAIFVDSESAGIAGLPVKVGLQSAEGSDHIFGTVTAPEVTDESGELEISYRSTGRFGRINVFVQSDLPGMSTPLDTSLTLTIQQLVDDVGSISIRAKPNFLMVSPDSLAVSNITATVRDENNVGIPGVVVDFVTDFGSISKITPTDADGVASAEWRNDYREGVAHILARIPGTEYEATVSIVAQIFGDGNGSLSIYSDVETIYADRGITYANIEAILKDPDNQPLSGEWLTFTCTHGTLISPVMTDGGRAKTIFTDIGIPSLDQYGRVVPAKIYVKYLPLNLIDSCEVTILPRNPVAEISLTTNKNTVTTGDTVSIRATAVLFNGRFASVGTILHLEILSGNIRPLNEADTIGNFGAGSFSLIIGTYEDPIRLRAWVDNDDGSRTYSNEVELDFLPGPPGNIRLIASPTELMTNDPDAYSTISAILTDTSGNPMQYGYPVRFRTTLGQITRNGLTDNEGQAVARLTPGRTAGIAIVTGTIDLAGGDSIWNETSVTFVAGYPNTITLTADPEELNVPNGPNTHSTLTARVFDPNGNPIGRSAIVVFRMLNQPPPPNGCSFSNGTQIDSARTANGVARMSLNAGYYIGGVLVKAYTWRDPDTRRDTIDVINNRIQVVAGPPCAIDIDYSTAGEDVGGGMWKIPVTARVYDNHLNPVADGIPVMFTVIPDDIASITNGRTENGIAHVELFYHSSKTYDLINIQAEINVGDGMIVAQREGELPLQQGRLTFHCDPANWRFDRDNADDTCLIRTWAILTDGHGILINNAPILFSTDRAQYYWRNPVGGRYVPYYPNPARKYTGINNDQMADPPGFATVYLRGTMNDFFLEDETLETRCNVWAQVEGLDVIAEPRVVTVTRR